MSGYVAVNWHARFFADPNSPPDADGRRVASLLGYLLPEPIKAGDPLTLADSECEADGEFIAWREPRLDGSAEEVVYRFADVRQTSEWRCP